MRREASRKRLALAKAYGRPWWEVAMHWAVEPKSQAEIAAIWTAAVFPIAPEVRFTQPDVSDIMVLARRRTEGQGNGSSCGGL